MPYLTTKDRPLRSDYEKDKNEIWLPSKVIIEFADMVSEQIFPNTKNGLKAFLKMRQSKIGKQRKG